MTITIQLTNYLLIIGSITLTVQLIRTINSIIQSFKETIKKREKDEQFKGNHPEMRGIDIDEEELLCFTSGEGIKHQVLMNDDEGDNTPLMTKLMDEYDFDEDDDD